MAVSEYEVLLSFLELIALILPAAAIIIDIGVRVWGPEVPEYFYILGYMVIAAMSLSAAMIFYQFMRAFDGVIGNVATILLVTMIGMVFLVGLIMQSASERGSKIKDVILGEWKE